MAPRRPNGGQPGDVRSRIDPRLIVVAGAVCIGMSSMCVKLSDTSGPTATFFRCALALPILLPLLVAEHRRMGGRSRRELAVDLLAGTLLGIDLMLWTGAISTIGAGISSVVVNVQVIIVPLLALVFLREHLPGRFLALVPVMLIAVALAGGVVGAGLGTNPVYGLTMGTLAGVAYAGYLFLLRFSSEGGYRAYPVFVSTFAAGATGLVTGLATGNITMLPGWSAVGWLALLAVTGQVLGWLLLSAALPRLRSNVGATLLLLQPVLALLLGVLVLGEAPGLWQYVGSALVIVVVWLTSRTTRSRRRRPASVTADPPPTG